MSFTTPEIQAIKHWLGYGNLTASARPFFDIAQVFEVVVQQNIDAFGETYVRTIVLPNITQLEIDIQDCRIRFQAKVADDVTLNPMEFSQLAGLREWWINRLSETIRVPRATSASGPIGSSIEIY